MISVPRIPLRRPDWVYLDSVGRVPLLSRDQEAEFAMRMESAQEKLCDMAFRSPAALDSLYHIAAEFKRTCSNARTFLQIEEDQIDKTDECEKLRTAFSAPWRTLGTRTSSCPISPCDHAQPAPQNAGTTFRRRSTRSAGKAPLSGSSISTRNRSSISLTTSKNS